MHLLEGLFFGMRNIQTVIGERERLLALGSLSAGLTHELNNPAAAAVRATSVLRDRVAGMRHKLAMIADGRLDGTPAAHAGRAAGGGGQAGGGGARADPDADQRRRGRARRLAGRARHHRGVGHRADAGRGRRRRGVAGPGRRPPSARSNLEARGPLAHLHPRHRAADARDRRLGHPHLRAGRRRQAVLAARPRAAPDRRRARPAQRHAGHAQRRRSPRASRSSRSYDRTLPPIPAYAGRAQPGLDQPHRQRARRDGRRRAR